MASSGSLQNSCSEEDLLNVTDQRKRKRMLSNRESARRSRIRKQKHLGDLTEQVDRLQKENEQIQASTRASTQLYTEIEAENSVLRAQMEELSQRLKSLDEISDFLNASSTSSSLLQAQDAQIGDESFVMMNSWNPLYMNQPIMPSTEMFMY